MPEQLTYISWAESCSRSDHTARELGGVSHMVYAARFGSHPATIILKYAVQWLTTARILAAERPAMTAVMSPPLVAAIPAFWHAWRTGGGVLIDAHSAAFLHPRWRRWQWLQRALCRRAVTTIVHNERIAELVREAGGHATVVEDVPVVYAKVDPFERTAAFTAAVVCSFNYDEPVEAIWDAARLLPDVQFHVTGNPKHLKDPIKSARPQNVSLTGFLSVPAYGGLLSSADVVITLTTRDHTMLRGAYEAIYQGTPVIVSDWPLLRQSFPEGALHVDNSPAAIADAVRRIQASLSGYRAGAQRLREAKLERWQDTKRKILGLIARPAELTVEQSALP
jgi:glycosyltransferase involved in cell wall biosynthesis